MYNSEAQAYQAIRRTWKKKRNSAQRKQVLFNWQVLNKEAHPMIRKAIAKITGQDYRSVRMPIDTLAEQIMYKSQSDASFYQLLLNQFRVEKHNEN